MSKKVGFIPAEIIEIKPNWIEAKMCSTGSLITIFFPRGMSKNQEKYFKEMKSSGAALSFFVKKEPEPGFFIYIRNSLPRRDGRKSKTTRLRAEADQRQLLREIENPAHSSKSGRTLGFQHRDAFITPHTTNNIRSILGDAIREKPKGVEKIKTTKRRRLKKFQNEITKENPL